MVGRLDRGATVYIAGKNGLVGSAIWRHLERAGFRNLVGHRSAELDLRDQHATDQMIADLRPDVIIDAAARVGGILANAQQPAEFLSDNLRIQLNLMDAAREHDVEQFLFLGSSCVYPKFAEQPIREESLLTGPLEQTNDAYAIAKIAGITQIQALRREDGRRYISAMPTNLYGPGDNFHPTRSHVLPGMMRRFHEAVASGSGEVVNWGTGQPRREFLHVDDLAAACLFLLEHYDGAMPVNVGVGQDVTIAELADVIAGVTGFRGQIVWDTSKPDGTPQKLLDVSRLTELGWSSSISLEEGIRETYDWYLNHLDTLSH